MLWLGLLGYLNVKYLTSCPSWLILVLLVLNWKSYVLGALLSCCTGYLVTLFIIFIASIKVNLFLDTNSCNVLAFQIEKQTGGMAQRALVLSGDLSFIPSTYLYTTVTPVLGDPCLLVYGHQAHIWYTDTQRGNYSYT